MHNPLLDMTGLPPFASIRPEHVEPAIDRVLADNRAGIEALVAGGGPFTWVNLVRPLGDMEDRLSRVWAPVGHMNSVVNSEETRRAYNACLPKLSAYATEMGQNRGLFEAFRAIAEGPEYQRLDAAQRRVIDNALRDFRLSGVALAPAAQARYREIQAELASLTAKFEENLLDATNAWSKHIGEEARLAGLPETTRAQARHKAQEKGLEGWLLTLEGPCYVPVMTYADDRDVRYELYHAYVTRASDQGPHGGRWDNGPLMERILELRHEHAQLLGFANYAERSLATKMAPSPEHVMEFLNDLARRSLSMARAELEELADFARRQHGHERLEAWDISYYSEKLRRHKYAISQEDLRPYFPEQRVLNGLFSLIERLYGMRVEEIPGVETWHPDVRFYEICDSSERLRGQFYLDLYARSHKRGGAWMDECIVRKRTAGSVQTPVAFLTCNFSAPVAGNPVLLTHNEVITLFHEFGHGLHHMLTQVDYPAVAGINGVAWDAVELPSQFMENWCWTREALDMISGHYRSGEPLPDDLYQRMLAAKNFQAGMQMVRQLEFALFDFRLHLEYAPTQGARIQRILDEVRADVAVYVPPDFNRFAHGFSHIFAGGYAAGYYSYKWAEVLSSDAFAKFEEHGLFDRQTGVEFLEHILEQGGARDPMELFVEFRGREPNIDALLRHSGISGNIASQL